MIFDEADLTEQVQLALEELANVSVGTEEITLEDGTVKVNVGSVDVEDANVQQQIADALGVTIDQITFTPATVDMPATIEIPEEDITINFDELYSAIELAAEQASGTETAEVTASASATVGASSVDSSQAYTDTQTQTQTEFNTAFPTNGSTNVTVSQTNNADDVYREVGNDLKSRFSEVIQASAYVNVNVHWSLSNGANSITSSDGQTIEMSAALALYPVSMQQIMDIADSGKIMPPKATWFEPKLRSGLVIHKLS